MKSNNLKGPSQRQLRVGEQLKHIVAETLKREEFYWPDNIDPHDISVIEVRPSPDLRNATVYIAGPEGCNIKEILALLNEEKNIFQKEVGRQGTTKFTPRIAFKHDYSIDNAQRIEGLLSSITYSNQEDE